MRGFLLEMHSASSERKCLDRKDAMIQCNIARTLRSAGGISRKSVLSSFPKGHGIPFSGGKNGEKYRRRAEEQLFDLACDRTSARTKVIVRAFLTVAVVLVLNTEIFLFPKCKKSFVPRISLIKGALTLKKRRLSIRIAARRVGAKAACVRSERSATTMIFTKKGIRLRGNGNTIGGETC